MNNTFLTIIPAACALAGTIIGGLISFLTTYYLKKKEWQQKELSEEIKKREKLYTEFISESGRFLLYSIDFKIKRADEFAKLTMLLGKIRMISSPEVISAAETICARILKSQHSNKKEEDDKSSESEKEDYPIFSDACRTELENLRAGG